MSQDRFHKGLANIRVALDTAISERAVIGSSVDCGESSEPQDTRFAVTVGGRTEAQTFTREEIEDSGEAIDAPVAVKVRMLVSYFVR